MRKLGIHIGIRRGVAAAALAAHCGLALLAPSALRADADDEQLELGVRLALLQKLGVDGLRVEVRAADGEVLLAGQVRKRETSELAEEVAKNIDGVRRVENQLELAEYAESRGQAGVAATETERELRDARLQTRVKLALIDRLGTDGFRIGTDAAGGSVTLEFPAGMPAERRAEAVRVARLVGGVEKVIELEKR
jgi:osmotically-inducible protein OsmY